MHGDPALWCSDPTTTRLPLPPTAEIIVQAQVGVRKLSQASALLLGLPPQPKADRQPPGRAASTWGPTQCLHWRRRGLDSLNLLSNCWALPALRQLSAHLTTTLPGSYPVLRQGGGRTGTASKSGWGQRGWTGPKEPGAGEQVDKNLSRGNNYSINHLPNSSGEYYHFFSFNSQI